MSEGFATYKRGQVEWALWRFVSRHHGQSKDPPKVFRTRIKRLLELDRVGQKSGEQFAFAGHPPEGQGVDVAFTAFDAFCLGFGLDLLDTGFKQSEVVFLIRHIRQDLCQEYKRTMSDPTPDHQYADARDYPDWPSYQHRNFRVVDCRVFAVIEKVEMTEIFSSLKDRTARKEPLIMEPKFCRGIEELREELHNMNDGYRKAMVLEMAYTAVGITELLEQAPVVRRGRT